MPTLAEMLTPSSGWYRPPGVERSAPRTTATPSCHDEYRSAGIPSGVASPQKEEHDDNAQ
jgi:hypothetical protein